MIISPKADGTRCLLLIGITYAEILTEKLYKRYEIN